MQRAMKLVDTRLVQVRDLLEDADTLLEELAGEGGLTAANANLVDAVRIFVGSASRYVERVQ